MKDFTAYFLVSFGKKYYFTSNNNYTHIVHIFQIFFYQTEDMLFCIPSCLSHPIRPMHEVVPRVVAIAVNIVMAKWMIFCQSSFFMMVDVLMVDL